MRKGSKHSAESLEKMSLSRQGYTVTPETRAKQSAALKGHVVSDETRVKLSAARKGYKFSPDVRANMSAGQRGRVATPETKARLSAARAGRSLSEQHSRNISAGVKKAWESPEFRNKAIAGMKERWVAMDPAVKQQRIERWSMSGSVGAARKRLESDPPATEKAVMMVLIALDVDFEREYQIGRYHADFYIPARRLVLECDGDFWHRTKRQKAADARRDDWIRAQGYRVVRLSETEIVANAPALVAAALAESA